MGVISKGSTPTKWDPTVETFWGGGGGGGTAVTSTNDKCDRYVLGPMCAAIVCGGLAEPGRDTAAGWSWA